MKVFDELNARNGVPASFVGTAVQGCEAIAPLGRGYIGRDGCFVPLTTEDNELCDLRGVPAGQIWKDHHDYISDWYRFAKLTQWLVIEPEVAAERLSKYEHQKVVWNHEIQKFQLRTFFHYENRDHANLTREATESAPGSTLWSGGVGQEHVGDQGPEADIP